MKGTLNILPLVIILLFFSCKNEKASLTTETNSHSENFEKISLQFPDIIESDTEIQGKVKYDLELDSATQKGLDERFIFLHIVVNDDKDPLSLESIKKAENYRSYIDTTGNGTYYFIINSKEKGEKTLHGVIEDARFMKSEKKEINSEVVVHKVVLTKHLTVK